MDDFEIRKKILKALYQADRENPDVGYRKEEDLSNEFGVDRKSLEFNASYLVRTGFVEYAAEGGCLVILPKGINFVEGPSPFNPPQKYKDQSIQIRESTVGNIVQAYDITINPSEFFQRLAAEIEDLPAVGSEKKKDWKESLLQMATSSEVTEIARRIIDAIRLP